MTLRLYNTYTEQSAVDVVGENSGSTREACFVRTGDETIAFFALGSSPNARLVTAFKLRWPGILPSMLHDQEESPPIHGLIRPRAEDQFVYIGQLKASWRCESDDPGECYVDFRLLSPITKDVAWRLGITSPWAFRLVSESTVDGERKHFCCSESVRDDSDLEHLLAITDEKDDVEVFLRHFFTLCEVNANLNAKQQAVITFMKEDEADGQDCFYEYSRGESAADGSETDFYDCSPIGFFVPIPIPTVHVVPRAKAMEALREYFRTGKRPTCVEWGDYAM
jgi:hypothetical protein